MLLTNSLLMENKEEIHSIGEQLAKLLKGFFGAIQFNLQGGKYVNANINESIRPEKEDK